LNVWLAGEDDLCGRVQLVQPPPAPGTLGLVPGALAIALGQGGAGAVLAGALIAWLRHRTSDVMCTLKRTNGSSVELSAKRVQALDAAGMREMLELLSTTLTDETSPKDDSRDSAAGEGSVGA
jgi:hypothetical protein